MRYLAKAKGWKSSGPREKKRRMIVSGCRNHQFVLPYFTDHAFAFAKSMKEVGLKAEVLSLIDDDL
jgi:hypothetical protein